MLLVSGLGMTVRGWWRTVPVLDRSFRVLSFDHRGMGRSGSPWGSASLVEMAGDAVAVLDAAGVERAHVYGLSLGGMVAQHTALLYPDRVRSLALGATTPGGPRAAPPAPEVLAMFGRRGTMSAEEALWASVPHTYGRATRRHHAEKIGQDIARRLDDEPSATAYAAQLLAAPGHDTLSRLEEITAPTLVVHGEEDRVVPSGNAHLIAAAIPGAGLHVWPGAGHLYTTDEPEADRQIARFLSRAG